MHKSINLKRYVSGLYGHTTINGKKDMVKLKTIPLESAFNRVVTIPRDADIQVIFTDEKPLDATEWIKIVTKQGEFKWDLIRPKKTAEGLLNNLFQWLHSRYTDGSAHGWKQRKVLWMQVIVK